jgi:hypothetical protein
MYPCSSCDRHLREEDSTCPFCGTQQHATPSPLRSTIAGFALVAATMLGTTACARNPSMADDANTTTTAGSSDTESGSDTESESEWSTMGDGDGDTSNQDTDASLSFYACAPDDDYFSPSECDPFAQDCPEGEKCVAYASTADVVDANKCVPVTGSGAVDDPCIYGGVIEGTDDCDQHSYCYFVEDVEGVPTGTCKAFCEGTPDEPECAVGSACVISNEGSLTLCLPSCHPVLQDCVAGQACGWSGGSSVFTCDLEADDAGAIGEVCGPGDSCVSGSVCASSEVVPDCQGDGCCVEYCDLEDLEFVCSNPEAACTSFFEQEPPAGLEAIGICVSPP